MNTTNQRTRQPAAPAGTNGDRDAAAPSPPAATRPRAWVYAAFLGALLLGLAVGIGWHTPLAALVGLHDHNHSAASGQAGGKKQLWTCSMHPQVIKEEPGSCPICHMALTPLNADAAAGGAGSSAAGGGERKVKYWWDPMMNPPYISDKPGKSPMGMDLVPVYEDQVSGGAAVTINPVVVQNMGVRVAPVTTGSLVREVRAVGYLDEAQPNVRDVNLRVSGWVEKLYADTVGMALSKGAPLFDLYSPEVQVATEELIAARKSVDAQGPGGDALARKSARTLLDATRLKLEQWSLDAEQVDRLAKLDTPPRTVTFNSPIDGYLTQKMLVQGASVKAGDTVLRIVDLSTVWLDSQVYAQDLPVVRLGRTVTAAVEGVPGKQFEGQVIFVQPELDPQTRTATVRIALPNRELALRPGMYATARVRATLAERATLVPREAVIDTGARQIAFVVEGEGRFQPRQVRLGAEGEGGVVQVLEGLAPGETVVTSGQFLLDAESRMREAIQKHLDERLLVKAPDDKVGHVHAATPTTNATATAGAPQERSGTMEHPAPAGTWSPNVDHLFTAYLAVQRALGAPQQADTPVDVTDLVKAAMALADEAGGGDPGTARRLSEAAEALEGKSLAGQRALFKPLSDAAIALAKSRPPSAAVAAKLYVAYCPMGPGDGARWIQAGDAIANPYFATKMKDCGSIERIVEVRDAPDGHDVGTPPSDAPTTNRHEDGK